MLRDLLNLFIGFGRATLLGYGGGPSIVPLYEHEAVNVFKWMTTEEFGQALAFGNALPGPIAVKLTMYIGYKVAGWAGAFVSLLVVTLPVGLAMIFLFAMLGKFKGTPFFNGMVAGVRPVVFVMLAMLAMDFAKYAFAPAGQGFLSWLPFVFAAAFFVSVHYFNIHPAWGVLSALILGGIFLK